MLPGDSYLPLGKYYRDECATDKEAF